MIRRRPVSVRASFSFDLTALVPRSSDEVGSKSCALANTARAQESVTRVSSSLLGCTTSTRGIGPPSTRRLSFLPDLAFPVFDAELLHADDHVVEHLLQGFPAKFGDLL